MRCIEGKESFMDIHFITLNATLFVDPISQEINFVSHNLQSAKMMLVQNNYTFF